MTFRAKPVTKRSSRPSRAHESRRTLFMNIGFGLVVVAAVGILLAAAGAAWYGDNYGTVATVNGVNITRADYRTRYKIEAWRFSEAEARLRDEANAGHITAAQRDQAIASLQQQAQSLDTLTLQHLIDSELQKQLAAQEGVTVTDAQIQQRLTDEATTAEQRHIYVIEVQPQVSAGATDPTAEQVAAAQAKADQALADIKGGKSFQDVAKAVSTSATSVQGGDLGWYMASNSLDPAFSKAVFAASLNQPTDVIKGADGIFRIGEVTEISPKTVDSGYDKRITDAGISLSDYKAVVASDVRRDELDSHVVASVVDTATVQRRVSEIWVPEPQGVGDEVQVRHILFAPNHITDQTQLSALPSDDPAWTTAQKAAQAAYDQLKPLVGTPQLETEFQKLASQESDDPGSKSNGGLLPYYTRDQVDQQFGDAIFATGLKQGDLIGPVRTQYGWHVILFENRRADPQSRIDTAKLQADASGGDFAAIAKQVSEGPDASTGGDIGWVAKYQLNQQLEDAIFATPIGKTSDVVEVSGGGFYLFKVWEQQTRKPDATQTTTLQSSAFTNWYAAQKAKATITQDVTALPSPGA